MNLTKFSIRRPVSVFMCIVMILLFGFVSLSKLPLDLFPSLGLTYAAVVTEYRGAGPYEVENMVTKPIEDALGTVSNLKQMRSESTDGSSVVLIEFEDGTDMDFATLQMREKIDLIKGMLPDGVQNPMVFKFDPSMAPVLYISVGSSMPIDKLTSYVDDNIKPNIERVKGVASVSVEGKEEREISVELLPEKILGYGLNQNQIVGILQSENNNTPGGKTYYGERDITIRSISKFKSVADVENIPISLPNGGWIKLSDIAIIKDTNKEQTNVARLNGQQSIMLSIQKQSNANTVQVINSIKKEMNKLIEKDDRIDMVILFDQAQFIEQVLQTVFSNAVFGGLLAVIVLWFFLKNFKMALSIGTAIPISVIATLILIYFSGITLNMISLGGLALGIGMLVDNSIVVLENIYRYHMLGYSRYDSVVKGTGEISSAVVASTMTSVVVFLPIIFLSGLAAKIFKELAMTVSFSLATSLIVSLTVMPLLCYIMLGIDSKKEESGKVHSDGSTEYKFGIIMKILHIFDLCFEKIKSFYGQIILYALGNRKKVLALAIAIFIGSFTLIPFMGAEFMPQSDEGKIDVNIELPNGKSLEETNKVVKKVEKYLMQEKNIEKVSSIIGSMGMGSGSTSTAYITAVLVDKNEREKGTDQVAEEIRTFVKDIPGCKITVTKTQSLGMGGGSGDSSAGVALSIYGADIDKLKGMSLDIEKIMASVEGVRGIKSSISDGAPELQVKVDKSKAAMLNLTASEIAATVRGALDGTVATKLSVDGDEIDIRVKTKEGYYNNSDDIKNITIPLKNGSNVQLGTVAEISLEKGPSIINREGKERVVTLSAQIHGRDVSTVNEELRKLTDKYVLDEGYRISFGGQFDMMTDAFVSLTYMFVLSTLLVYIVMAMQFESFIYPFVIMFAIPFALSGSLIFMFITGKPISIITFIGIIVLVGIVVNNSIVLVDYINTLRKEEGLDKNDAIVKAGLTRLKPIMMTALTTILGLIPLFLSRAEGAEMQSALAAVVIGGLSFSTILTLVVVPIIYYILDEKQAKFLRKFKKEKTDEVKEIVL